MLEIGMEPIRGHRLTRPLGQGGFAQVWEAVDPAGAFVALKFIECRNQPPALIANEIRILLKLRELRHPNIIRLFDVCASSKYIVLKMERADGSLKDLEDVYRQETGRCIPPDHLLDLIDQAAVGLDFLAEQARPGLGSGGHGMQHCDVKPSNLLVHQDVLKIADFGLSMASLSLTHGGRFMGTPPYAAPELHSGKVSTHTDQYGLAVTWCELVSGGRVMADADPFELSGASSVDLRKVRVAELPVIARAVDPDWTKRWPNCRAFVNALREALQRPRQSNARKLGSREMRAMREMTAPAIVQNAH